MARLGQTFDATAVEPTKAYELLPPGRYPAQIVASEMRPTRDGLGQYLWLELDLLEDEHRGRKLFDRLNLVNANPQTVEIAQRTLSAICHATGRLQVQDSEELHLAPMLLDVKVQPARNEGFGPSNAIRYLPLERAARPRPHTRVAVGAAPVLATAPEPAGQPRVAPWKRKA
jgi:hypothetical protein